MAAYGDEAGFTAWLTEHGYALPDGHLAVTALLARGSAYIDGVYGPRFGGTPAGGFAQALAWPRVDAYAYGALIGDTVIPDAVVQASYHAAYAEAVTPGSLSVSYTPGTAKVLKKVDKIEWEVIGKAEGANGGMTMVLTAVEGLLAPFLVPIDAFPAILVV